MKKVLFVCTGNTCRSPMAKVLFEKLLKDNGITDVIADSAGISAFLGDYASENAINAMVEDGLDLTDHTSKRVSQYLVNDADYIIALSQNHKDILMQYYPQIINKVFVLGKGISDPYGLDIETYRQCKKEIKAALPDVLDKVKQNKIDIMLMDESHIDEVSQIERECFSIPWSKEQFCDVIKKDYALFCVATVNNAVAGYIGLYCIAGEGQITNVAVKQNFRRLGIAERLFNYVKKEAKRRDVNLFTLEVREANLPAINLYKKMGFNEDGLRPNFYEHPRENAILMSAVI